jgi:hypothetical protein
MAAANADGTRMSHDLSPLLVDFDYEPGRLKARVVRAADGRELLQVRVELGLLQMECEGRPDGRGSVVGEADAFLRQRRAVGGDVAGADASEQLLGGGALAAALRLELIQYQQRAVAFLAVGDFARALRDAEAVRVGTTMVAGLGGAAEREWSESARFSAVVLRTRAAAAMLAVAGRTREAGSVIESGLAMLREAAEFVGIDEHFDTLADVRSLRALRDTLVPQLPPAQRSELEERLRAAVRAENYELAAILRDELRLL